MSTPAVRVPDAPASPSEDLLEVAGRIARAIAAAQSAPPESAPRVLVFRVGAARVALPLAAVREVVLPAPLSRVPRAPAAVLGIMNLRGRVVSVVDLLHALPADVAGLAGAPEAPGAALEGGRILLLERGRQQLGLLVRDVEGIAAPPAQSDEGAPKVLDVAKLGAAIEALVD